MRLRDWSIGTRIRTFIAVPALLVLLTVVGAIAAMWGLRDRAVSMSMDAVEARVREKLEVSTHAAALVLAEGLRGLDGDDARDAHLRDALETLRYEDDGSGYFFVFRGTAVVTIPPKPELVGRDMATSEDANGVRYVAELRDAAAAGGGFVAYDFPKPGAGVTPKLGYAERIPGTPYWIGTGVYVDHLDALRGELEGQFTGAIRAAIGWVAAPMLLLLLGVVLPVGLAIGRSITQPLREARDAMLDIAGGEADLTHRLAEDGRDEVSELAAGFNRFVEQLEGIVGQLSGSSTALSAAATELTRRSDGMAGSASKVRGCSASTSGLVGEVSERVHAMASASQDASSAVAAIAETTTALSGEVERLATGTEEMSATVGSVATALEELDASFQEVARSTGRSASATGEAAERVQSAVEGMRELGTAAEQVSQIVGLIRSVADQTNLLALNATIEAANAGDAGRGFVVVANEVKELAHQTAAATTQIGEQVEAMKHAVAASVAAFDGIQARTGEARELNDGIAAAVEEQSGTVAEIARTISRGAEAAQGTSEALSRVSSAVGELARSAEVAARGTDGIASSVDDTAGHTTAMTRDMQALEGESAANAATVEEVAGIAVDLDRQARDLGHMVARFRVH